MIRTHLAPLVLLSAACSASARLSTSAEAREAFDDRFTGRTLRFD